MNRRFTFAVDNAAYLGTLLVRPEAERLMYFGFRRVQSNKILLVATFVAAEILLSTQSLKLIKMYH